MKRIKAFWESLAASATISKRELFLGLTTCVLAGIVFGAFFGPKKTITIGSNNESNSRNCGYDGAEDEAGVEDEAGGES